MNVWGTWCGECRIEHRPCWPSRTRTAYPSSGSTGDEDAAALEWLSSSATHTVVAVDGDSRTAIDYGVYGAPETFFVDANGLVQYRHGRA